MLIEKQKNLIKNINNNNKFFLIITKKKRIFLLGVATEKSINLCRFAGVAIVNGNSSRFTFSSSSIVLKLFKIILQSSSSDKMPLNSSSFLSRNVRLRFIFCNVNGALPYVVNPTFL